MIRTIRDKFFSSVLQSSYGDAGHLIGSSSLKNLAYHGTTVGAFLIEDGRAAIAFSDGKVSEGNSALSFDFCKMFQIDRYSCMLLSGALGAGLDMVTKLRTMIGFTQDANNIVLTPEMKINYLVQLQRLNMPLAEKGMLVAPLFVTYDPIGSHLVCIAHVGPDGTWLLEPAIGAKGSGAAKAESSLEDNWKPGMNEQEGIELVRRTRPRTKKDLFTGGAWVLWRIDTDGVREIERWSDELV